MHLADPFSEVALPQKPSNTWAVRHTVKQ